MPLPDIGEGVRPHLGVAHPPARSCVRAGVEPRAVGEFESVGRERPVPDADLPEFTILCQ